MQKTLLFRLFASEYPLGLSKQNSCGVRCACKFRYLQTFLLIQKAQHRNRGTSTWIRTWGNLGPGLDCVQWLANKHLGCTSKAAGDEFVDSGLFAAHFSNTI